MFSIYIKIIYGKKYYREASDYCWFSHLRNNTNFVQGIVCTFTHTISMLYNAETYHFEGHFALVDLRYRSGLQNVDHLAEVDPILQRLVESFRVGVESRRERFSGNFCQPFSCYFIQTGIVFGGFLHIVSCMKYHQHTRREKVTFYLVGQFSRHSISLGSFRHCYRN